MLSRRASALPRKTGPAYLRTGRAYDPVGGLPSPGSNPSGCILGGDAGYAASRRGVHCPWTVENWITAFAIR